MLSTDILVALCFGFFVIATLYSAVGFGGGSSYLALLTLFFDAFFPIRSIALLCNLVVVTGSSILYFKKGHGNLKDFLPFVITSVPLAFIGASFRLSEQVFFLILGFALVTAALFMGYQTFSVSKKEFQIKKYPTWFSYVIGGGIGLLSGVVGIGGGIFLAPILYHLKWGKAMNIAALASFFILVNSVSGLAGLVNADALNLPWKETLLLMFSVFIGGQLGIRLSLKQLSANSIKRVTAILVLVVGIRVILVNGFLL